MKTSRFISGMVAIVATILMFYACSKEESHPKPEALFSYTIGGDGRTINFTNESTNATSYTWDFGDGQTSTEVNPVHTFAEYKEYTITLTAKGPGGENVFTYKLTVTKSSPVKLDDNSFDDWSTIPDAFVSVDNNGGIINKVKLDYDGDYIYFYMEVQDNITDSLPTGIYFDLDNDSTTGFKPWTHHAIGVDLYIEAAITTGAWSSVFEVDPALDPGWPWSEVAVSDYLVNGYHAQAGAVVKVEWAFKRSKMTAPKKQLGMGNKVTLVMTHYVNWEPAGFFPAQGAAACVFNMQP